MKKFFFSTFLFFVGAFMCVIYLIAIPIIGDWIKSLKMDARLIAAGVILFFLVCILIWHRIQKRADHDWLTGKYDNEIK